MLFCFLKAVRDLNEQGSISGLTLAEKLLTGFHAGKRSQRSHIRGLNGRRRNSNPLPRQVFCGTAIGNQPDFVTRILLVTHGGIHAHVGHHAADHKRICVYCRQSAFQVRLIKTVWRMLRDNLSRPGQQLRMQQYALRTRSEKAGVLIRNMLNIENRQLIAAEIGFQPYDLLQRFVGTV